VSDQERRLAVEVVRAYVPDYDGLAFDADLDDTVPAKRPITLEDLLTFRLGLGMVFAQAPYPIVEAEKELQLATLNPPYPPSPHSTDEWLRRLGTLPLINQPGEQWMYNTGA